MSARAVLGSNSFFCSSLAWIISIGPVMPTPTTSMAADGGASFDSSWLQITDWIGVAPCPPYSLGQFRHAQPASYLMACHSRHTSCISPAIMRSRQLLGVLASSQARTSVRNSASSGVSLKSTIWVLLVSQRSDVWRDASMWNRRIPTGKVNNDGSRFAVT